MTRKNKDLIEIELDKLSARGKLTKPNVVKLAENPKNPLHKEIFYCSDVKAAYEHRLERAGELIREYETKIIIRELEVSVPKWVHTKITPGFVHINEVRNSRKTSREFMRNELTMALALVKRCGRFAIVLGFDGQLTKIHAQLEEILSRI